MGAFSIFVRIARVCNEFLPLNWWKICELSHNEVTNEWNFTKQQFRIVMTCQCSYSISIPWFIALDLESTISHNSVSSEQNFMKLKMNFKQTRATSAGDINSPNLLVIFCSWCWIIHNWYMNIHNANFGYPTLNYGYRKTICCTVKINFRYNIPSI